MGALDYWARRLKEKGVAIQGPAGVGEGSVERFGERILSFVDPDGMQLELVGAIEIVEPPPPPPHASKGQPWPGGPVPLEHAIRGFHSVSVSEEGYEDTAKLLTEVMGFKLLGNEQNRFRYRAGTGDGFAGTVDLLCVPDARHGGMGAGVVHHVAFRTGDDTQQAAWRKEIAGRGFNVSPVMDRTYFHSIYYREPGGVLFEIATENPGFTVDQPADQLGARLMLPSWLEPHRAQIERAVPPIKLPPRYEPRR
jgi:glyoxalase family protein